MRIILSFVTLLMLAVYVYADDNTTVSTDEAVFDNVTTDNVTADKKKSKIKIKPKLVPDRLIIKIVL